MPRVGQPIWMTGVYMIRNKVNGKCYLGSASLSFNTRWNTHRSRLRKGTHPNRYFQSAWKKHGEDNFEFVILERCSPEECLVSEQNWLDKVGPHRRDVGYNLSPTATSVLGIVHSAEAREKSAAAKRGKKLKPESIAKRTEKQKGLKRSTETKARMSIAIKSSEATKRAAQARVGIPLSAETRKKISELAIGRTPSDEAKRNMGEAQRLRYAREREATKAKKVPLPKKRMI
jgi:group I intron endonuclease